MSRWIGLRGPGLHVTRASRGRRSPWIQLRVVKHTEAKRRFVLLPRQWVVERSFAWVRRFRRLAKDYERLPETVAGPHVFAFVCLILPQVVISIALSS